MSILAAIKRHVRAGRLFPLEMELASDPVVRGIYLSEDLRGLIYGPWASENCHPRVMRLQADLEAFVKGETVSLCLEPYSAGKAFFGRLSDVSDEVWDIRSRSPKPGLRLFGSFAAPNQFVAFTWRPRSKPWNGRQPMGDRYDQEWEKMKAECLSQWNALFPRHKPMHGEDADDYVTETGFSLGDI